MSNIKIKFIVCGFITSFIILIQGCSNDYDSHLDEGTKYDNENLLIMSNSKLMEIGHLRCFNSVQANYAVVRFLELIDNKYYMSLNENEALQFGISQKEFNRIQNEIVDVNLLINEWIEKKVDFTLSNPSSILNNAEISTNHLRLRLGSESSGSSRSFSSNSQDWTTSSFFIPCSAGEINITCSGGGLFTGYNVYVQSCGASTYKNGVAVLGTWSTSITPHCTNTGGTIGFKTTNSNGGTCTYSW